MIQRDFSKKIFFHFEIQNVECVWRLFRLLVIRSMTKKYPNVAWSLFRTLHLKTPMRKNLPEPMICCHVAAYDWSIGVFLSCVFAVALDGLDAFYHFPAPLLVKNPCSFKHTKPSFEHISVNFAICNFAFFENREPFIIQCTFAYATEMHEVGDAQSSRVPRGMFPLVRPGCLSTLYFSG